MVAYSFQKRFAEPILAGTKDQTIRGPRKRHARAGEDLQLYIGMRTKQCRLLARTPCLEVLSVLLDFDLELIKLYSTGPIEILRGKADLDRFARRDGFADFGDMRAFWRETHKAGPFTGALIRWQALTPEAAL